MHSSCPKSAVRSALITSVRGKVSELIRFVGFNALLSAILEAIDKRFGKKSTADHLQQEFFQLQQDKGEQSRLVDWKDPFGDSRKLSLNIMARSN